MEPMKPMKPMEPMRPMKPIEAGPPWWPAELGQPDTSGGQNDMGYAYFASARRLAVKLGKKSTLYDTADHRITGVSQQQHQGDGGATFTSQHGDIELGDLRQIEH